MKASKAPKKPRKKVVVEPVNTTELLRKVLRSAFDRVAHGKSTGVAVVVIDGEDETYSWFYAADVLKMLGAVDVLRSRVLGKMEIRR